MQIRHVLAVMLLCAGGSGVASDFLTEGVDAGRDVLDEQQAGVAAGHEHRQARLGQRAVLQLVDGDVRGEVVDAVQRLAQADRQGLGPLEPFLESFWAGQLDRLATLAEEEESR